MPHLIPPPSFALQLDGSTAGLAPALSSLTRLSLRCRLESAALAPDFPEGLSQLRRLELGCLRLAQFTPRLAQALSQLTHLACTGEGAEQEEGGRRVLAGSRSTPQRLTISLSASTNGADVLAARPRRRAGITLWEGLRRLASLRELRLEHQAGGGMPANALACAGLQGLTLLAAAADDWPAADLLRYSERCAFPEGGSALQPVLAVRQHMWRRPLASA